MRKQIFTILIIILLFSLGCSKETAVDDMASTDELTEDVQQVELTTAKQGLSKAESIIQKSKPDAVLVAISGVMDKDGKSDSWIYSFDSLKSSKGYEVISGMIKETKYSFNEKLTDWVDSSVVAKACGEGLATLEGETWTISNDDTCELDAESGKAIGEPSAR